MPAGDPLCARVHLLCDVQTADQLPRRAVIDLVVVTTYPDGHSEADPECWVSASRSRRQLITGQMLRDEAERLLPHPAIGVAPPGHATLVNIETVFWADTRARRDLGTVTVLGQRVDLRAHVRSVDWHFGDGASATTDGPGRAYSADDPCDTAQCADYFGHTNTDTGTVTITAAITWTGEFRVARGAWQPIPGTVVAAATSTTIDVREARAILVPNP
jgi:autotransporter-associated beta strand protein